MNTTIMMDDIHNGTPEKPGLQLAQMREKKGYSQEYVAGKLHLRVRIIELLEDDAYDQMPEPVFIKGYLRAYAKLLGVPADPLLEIFNNNYSPERKLDKTLWQSRRESNKGEKVVRILTGIIALSAIAIVGFWWQKDKDSQHLTTVNSNPVVAEVKSMKVENEIRLTDLSKMNSLFSPPPMSNKQTATETTSGG